MYSGRGKFMPLSLKSKILETPGYAVLVEKVGLFLEKVGLFWKKPYFFSDGQVLVV